MKFVAAECDGDGDGDGDLLQIHPLHPSPHPNHEARNKTTKKNTQIHQLNYNLNSNCVD